MLHSEPYTALGSSRAEPELLKLKAVGARTSLFARTHAADREVVVTRRWRLSSLVHCHLSESALTTTFRLTFSDHKQVPLSSLERESV